MKFAKTEKILLVNLVTILRVIAAAYSLYFLFKNKPLLALLICLGVAVTDAIDGWLARKLNAETLFGKLLDPLIDKVSIFALLFGLVLKVGQTRPVVNLTYLLVGVLLFGMLLMAEIFVVWLASSAFRETREKKQNNEKLRTQMGSNVWGKTKTGNEMFTLLSLFYVLIFSSKIGVFIGLFFLFFSIVFAFLSVRKHLLDYVSDKKDNVYEFFKDKKWFQIYEKLLVEKSDFFKKGN